jgi:RimJ/RimL family protein N-acetyltransferase
MAKHLARPATLTGTRVRLRAPHVDDAEAMFDGLASDPEVTHYLSWIPHRGVVETRRVITKLFKPRPHPPSTAVRCRSVSF